MPNFLQYYTNFLSMHKHYSLTWFIPIGEISKILFISTLGTISLLLMKNIPFSLDAQ